MTVDVIVAGAGIWGCTVARRLAESGRKVLVLEKRDVAGGNVRCETDGETGILSEGGWTAVEIPASAPWAAGDENCPSAEYRQTATAALSLPARLAPGGVLILRWSHPKVASGPMMAIDNVRLAFRRLQRALRITLW